MTDTRVGMRIPRRYTRAGEDPFESTSWERRDSRITNPDGSIVFEMVGAEVPAPWSQVATEIIVSKYFRKAGVPQVDEDGDPIVDAEGEPVLGAEWSARQTISRLAKTWRTWGQDNDYFASPNDAQAFEDELAYMLVHQIASPNSPQWFNTGLSQAYGLTGPAQGFWFVDPDTEEAVLSDDAYSRPSPHACFIMSVKDDLVNEGGIMDLWMREARLFKFGSGTGTNFSSIRGEGESLSGGGKSSGVMSFLKIGDRAAGAIKSGGTTRRAAKMVILDLDHPDIETFINWKMEEENKVRALIAAGYSSDFNGDAYQTVSGQNSNNSVRVPHEFLEAVINDEHWALTSRTDGEVMRKVRARELWKSVAEAAWACADPGVQFDTTINEWHTSPAEGRIRASNPCAEYIFLDNTACNLASLNLVKFYDDEEQAFDIDAYLHAVRLWTIVLEISVTMAQFPSREIAEGSYDYRTLGLGYANLGSLLMRTGIPYDSDEGRAIAGTLTAILTGHAYATSAEMASVLEPFPKFDMNKDSMLRVIRNHRRAARTAGPRRRPCPARGRSHRTGRPTWCAGHERRAAGCPVWPSDRSACSSVRRASRPGTRSLGPCPAQAGPGSPPGVGRNFFKIFNGLRVLRVVARPRREVAEPETPQLLPDHVLRQRDRKRLPDQRHQILCPPAHHPVNRRDRAALNNLGQPGALGVIQLRRRTRRGPVDQTFRAFGVEAMNPVAQSLAIHAADPRRLRPRPALRHRRQGQKAPRLRAILRARRKSTQLIGTKIIAKPDRNSTGHDEPPSVRHLESNHAVVVQAQ